MDPAPQQQCNLASFCSSAPALPGPSHIAAPGMLTELPLDLVVLQGLPLVPQALPLVVRASRCRHPTTLHLSQTPD